MTSFAKSPKPDRPVMTFLARHGFAAAELAPLPSDASPRHYARVKRAGLLVMEDRTDPVGFSAFVRLSRHLNSLGLSAPRVQGADPAVGLALIEDFGEDTYGNLLRSGHDERGLYQLATDVLAHLHMHPDAAAVTVPVYDLSLMLDEISEFSQWFVPALRPDVDAAGFDETFRRLWRQALEPALDCPPTLVLRDFHVDNLMLVDGRIGVQRCGLLDFQDGAAGPGEYDLVSLLQDARRDLAEGLEAEMLERYTANVAGTAGEAADSAEAIRHRYHLMGAQRHTRLLGRFHRLDKRDGKPGYLAFLPRVTRQLETSLHAAGLGEIETFLDASLSGWRHAASRAS